MHKIIWLVGERATGSRKEKRGIDEVGLED